MADRQTKRQTGIKTDRQTNKGTDRQKDRHTASVLDYVSCYPSVFLCQSLNQTLLMTSFQKERNSMRPLLSNPQKYIHGCISKLKKVVKISGFYVPTNVSSRAFLCGTKEDILLGHWMWWCKRKEGREELLKVDIHILKSVYSHSLSLTHTYTHKHAHTHIHAHTRTHAHAHTHTNTHTLS